MKRLHHILVHAQVLREEIEKGGRKLVQADDDLGRIKAFIRTTGLRGVRFGPRDKDSDAYFCCEGILEDP